MASYDPQWLDRMYNPCDVRRSASAEQPEFVMAPRVKDCRFAADAREGVTAWRWDVELLPAQKQGRVKPLFTFTAVPPQEKNR